VAKKNIKKPSERVKQTGSGAVATRGGTAAGAGGVAVSGRVGGDINVDNRVTNVTYYQLGEHGGRLDLRTAPLSPTAPPPPRHFTGRTAMLDRLAQELTSGENIALVGMGGVGKTGLARKLAERTGDSFSGGVLWWSLGLEPKLTSALTVWGAHAEQAFDAGRFQDLSSAAEMVRALLSKLGRVSAFLDDVWGTGPARTLMAALPAGCPVVITTRDASLAKSLKFTRIEHLEVLNPDEGLGLLAKLMDLPAQYEPAATEIVQMTGGLPLALELIAGLADSAADLPRLARQLKARPSLDLLRVSASEQREESVEASFGLSYERLEAPMQRQFRSLGYFSLPFERPELTAAWDERDDDVVEDGIRALIRRNLMQQDTASTAYQQHPLLQVYARQLLHAASEYEVVDQRVRDYYRSRAEGAIKVEVIPSGVGFDVPVEGRIIVGDNNFVVNTNYGSIIYNTVAPSVRRRETKPGPPRPPRGFLDRETELGQLEKVIEGGGIGMVCGPAGVGKTALLRQAANSKAAQARPHGILWIRCADEAGSPLELQDLVQRIFDELFETEPPLRVDMASARLYLSSASPLIVLDEFHLQGASLEVLADLVPQAAILVGSREQIVGIRGESIALGPLPREAAIQLLAYEMRVVEDGPQRAELDTIAVLLGDSPLALKQVGTLALENELSADAVATMLDVPTQSTEAIAAGNERAAALLRQLGIDPQL
jgi:hypothetical protein